MWEVLLIPSTTTSILPTENPILENGTLLIPATTNPLVLPIGSLNTSTTYYVYFRTVCSDSIKSQWTNQISFNTLTCPTSEKCNYKFLLTNPLGSDWSGGRIQVRQNGIVTVTLGGSGINNSMGVSVPLCPNVPIDLFWSIAGTAPQNIGISVVNPFLDIIYAKLPGEGTPLTQLFQTTGNCTPAPCSKPTGMNSIPSTTSAVLSWEDDSPSPSNLYDIYLVLTGDSAPSYNTETIPTISGVSNPYTLTTFNGLPLVPSTSYTFYVRKSCSPTEYSTWTILSPKTFRTQPLNDECENAIAVQVNTNQSCNPAFMVHGNTLGGTSSLPASSAGIGCGTVDDDIWFSFVAGPSGKQTINFTNVVNNTSTASIYHSLFSGSCGDLTKMYCSTQLLSNASGLIPGEIYYVRAYTNGSNPTQSVEFDLCILSPPANDNYINAQEVNINPVWECNSSLNQIGTTFGASPSTLPASTNCNIIDNDVWFKFTATNSIHNINLNSVVATSNSVIVKHSLYYGLSDAPSLLYCSNLLTSTASGLNLGQVYYIRVFSFGSSLSQSATFNVCVSTPPAPAANNDCNTAISIPVNENSVCSLVVTGNIIGATASVPSNTCIGNANDDVWFTFTAVSNTHIINLLNVEGTTTNLNHAVYTGTCDGGLVLVNCSPSFSLASSFANFIPNQLYYVRVWSNEAISQITKFDICIKSLSTCQNAEPFCGSSPEEPYIFANTIGALGNGEVACLFNTSNPIYYTLKVDLSGPLQYNILQNSQFDLFGNPVGANLDVDFVAWGPFSSTNSCDQIVFGPCSPVPCSNNTNIPNNYPIGNVVDCSYSSSFTETLSIPNAQEGEYYVILITNFNGNSGFIRMMQTNYAEPDAGQTYCSNKIQLISFLDINGNNVKDNDEVNFSLGSFVYQKNNIGDIHTVNSPLGRHSIIDSNPANYYDFSFQIHPEYAAYYNLTSTNYNDINILEGNSAQTLYFPITLITSYNDASVNIISSSSPRAGSLYTNKIVYRNLGPTTLSGNLTFTKDVALNINNVNQLGVVSNPTGFTYNFNNLGAYETKSITVNMQVPPIPTVNLNDILINEASINILGDINSNDNIFSNSQHVVAAYDPNDKMESHGDIIDINNFSVNDYLYYTIRFQNVGNANAFNVRIEDLLDTKLDQASIRMISSSHNYTMDRVNNKVFWRFNNIQLVPMSVNEALSQGFVTFKIKLNPGFSVGDLIPNTAEIYFDTNPAIVTNTFVTSLQTPLTVPTFSQENIVLYPNPSNDFVQINLQNTSETIDKIVVFDVLGKSIIQSMKIATQQTKINVNGLSKGIYLVEITTENKLKLIKKLAVQ